METTGLFQQGVSCMQCHFNAGKQRRTEFVWTVPLRAFQPSPTAAISAREELLKSVQPATEALEKSVKP
jgi:hypothetical protein